MTKLLMMLTMQLAFVACAATKETCAAGDSCPGTADAEVNGNVQLLQVGVSVHSAGPPKLTKETAREFLTKAIETFNVPAKKTQLETLITESAGMDDMTKMMTVMPEIQTLLAPTLKEYGFKANDLMKVTMQIEAFAPEDATIADDVSKIKKALQGDMKDLFAEPAVNGNVQLLQVGVSVHSAGPPKLTKEIAREFLTKAIETFKAKRTQLETLITETDKETNKDTEHDDDDMMKMMKVMPVMRTLLAPTLTEYGFKANDLMKVTMQIEAFAPEDETIAADVNKIKKALRGDMKDLFDDPDVEGEGEGEGEGGGALD